MAINKFFCIGRRIFYTSVFFVLSLSCESSSQDIKEKVDSRPNFIIIFCDDMGYADISPFNDEVDFTPNLARMAEEGMKLSSFYVASPICSPSRAALLTGRQPFRMGINTVFYPSSWTGIPEEEVTIPEVLKENGYATGMVGKWHLGHHYQYLPLQNGFEEYFGIPYSNDMDALVYLDGNKVVNDNIDQKMLTKTFTEKALQYIEKHKEEPFFLYLAHAMPHVPIYPSEKFEGSSKNGLYADVIKELDWSTGEILKKLKEVNIDENTIVVFSSDNGPWLAFGPHGGKADPLREGKNNSFEGGQRVPTIIRWQKKIQPNSEYSGITTTMDLFPTFINLAGITVPEIELDGEDISSILLQSGEREKDEFVYNAWGTFRGIRKGDWKLKLPYGGSKQSIYRQFIAPHDTLLFNLKEDIGENNDLSKKYPEKVKELSELLEKRIKEYGELPATMPVKKLGDNSHIEVNKKRLGIK